MIENFTIQATEDPLMKEAEAIARANGGDPDRDDSPTESEEQLHARLVDWWRTEKERSQAGRDEMAIDADFRDGLQWSVEDAKVLRERGQDPLAFNRILPEIEWMVGTERRTRVDAKVLPRTKDDTEGARAQSDVLKYLADVNQERFHVSRAFDDAVTVGVGWVEDYVNPDPTKEALSTRYESWRYIWHDSASYEFDLSDARYVFRERWVDLDMAISMFPKRAGHLRMVSEGYDPDKERNEQFYLGNKLSEWEPASTGRSWNGFVHTTGGGVIRFGGRQRARLIEFQYRAPARVQLFVGGPHNGEIYNKKDPAHVRMVLLGESGLFKTHRMVMRLAVMTERGLLEDNTHPYKHDSFSFTPLWCYRRARDNQPYGRVRNLRGIQEDLNKRFARSLYRLSSQQVIVDEDATSDWVEFREQAFDPNGIVRKKRGAEVAFRQDYNTAEGDLKLMAHELQLFQDSGGLTNENLGRETNATSGRAVLARQQQGSIVMERIFDNVRLMNQLRGQKKLSNIRQFMSEARVLRLTDARGRADWLYINQEDPDTGQYNDVVQAQADYIVSEQDYRASMRLAMYDSLMEVLSRQPPEVAIQLLDLAFEVGDLPNQEELVKRIRKLNGQPDPDAQDSPEEKERAARAAQAEQAAQEIQQRLVLGEVAEREAKVEKLKAETDQIRSEIGSGDGELPEDHPLRGELVKTTEQLRQAQEQLAVAKVQAAGRERELSIKEDEVRERGNAEAVRLAQEAELKREESRETANTAAVGQQMEALQAQVKELAETVKKAESERKAAETERKQAEAEAERAKDAAAKAKEEAAEAKRQAREAAAKAREDVAAHREKAADKRESEAAKAKPDEAEKPDGSGEKDVKFLYDDKGNVIGARVKPVGKAGKKKE